MESARGFESLAGADKKASRVDAAFFNILFGDVWGDLIASPADFLVQISQPRTFQNQFLFICVILFKWHMRRRHCSCHAMSCGSTSKISLGMCPINGAVMG